MVEKINDYIKSFKGYLTDKTSEQVGIDLNLIINKKDEKRLQPLIKQ
jgi:hypothetical protein